MPRFSPRRVLPVLSAVKNLPSTASEVVAQAQVLALSFLDICSSLLTREVVVLRWSALSKRAKKWEMFTPGCSYELQTGSVFWKPQACEVSTFTMSIFCVMLAFSGYQSAIPFGSGSANCGPDMVSYLFVKKFY